MRRSLALLVAVLLFAGCDAALDDSPSAQLSTSLSVSAQSGKQSGPCFEDEYVGTLRPKTISNKSAYTNYRIAEYVNVRAPRCGDETKQAIFRVTAGGAFVSPDPSVLLHSVHARVLVNEELVFSLFSGSTPSSRQAALGTDTFGYTLEPGDTVLFMYDYEIETSEEIYRGQTGYKYEY